MAKMFNGEREYASSRIRGTYMLPKNPELPLSYIAEVEGPDDLYASRLIGSGGQTYSITDFEFAIGQLGYVNTTQEGPVFVTRMPLRRDWRQGLRSSQMTTVGDRSNRGVSSRWLDSNLTLVTDCIRGRYPRFWDSLEQTEETGAGAAISRRFAIDGKYDLHFRGRKVGRVGRGDRLTLDSKYRFLEEDLIQSVGEQNVSKL